MKSNILVDDFMANAKSVDKENDITILLNKIENNIYTKIFENVNGKLIDELKKNVNLQDQTPQPEFLRITPSLDTEYMHSHINYSKTIQKNHPLEREQFQQNSNKVIIDFPIYEQNYLDTQGNAKFYYPAINQRGLYDIPKQNADQTNVQNILITSTNVYDFQQPQVKQIFPRKLVEKVIPTREQPEYLKIQENNFNFSKSINKIGGLANTIQPMQESLQSNEKRLFLNTPEYSLLKVATQEKQIYVPPPYVPPVVPPLPDPFNTNPQFRLFGIEQQQPQFQIESFIPQKDNTVQTQQQQQYQQTSNIIEQTQQKSNISEIKITKPSITQQPKLNFLEKAKNERMRKEQNLQS